MFSRAPQSSSGEDTSSVYAFSASVARSLGHRSVRPTIGRLLINIDTTVAPLYVFVIALSLFTDAGAASPQAESSILC